MTIECGYYDLPESRKFRTSEEVACWYTEIEVPAGRYPVTADISASGHVEYLSVRFSGIVTDDYYAALWGGVPVSREPYKPRYVGQSRAYTMRVYGYDVLEGPDRNYPHYNETAARACWHVDLAVLPNVTRCQTCGSAVLNSSHHSSLECVRCRVERDHTEQAAIAGRYPRLLAFLARYSYDFAYDAGKRDLAAVRFGCPASFEREWHAKRVRAALCDRYMRTNPAIRAQMPAVHYFAQAVKRLQVHTW